MLRITPCSAVYATVSKTREQVRHDGPKLGGLDRFLHADHSRALRAGLEPARTVGGDQYGRDAPAGLLTDGGDQGEPVAIVEMIIGEDEVDRGYGEGTERVSTEFVVLTTQPQPSSRLRMPSSTALSLSITATRQPSTARRRGDLLSGALATRRLAAASGSTIENTEPRPGTERT